MEGCGLVVAGMMDATAADDEKDAVAAAEPRTLHQFVPSTLETDTLFLMPMII